MISGNNVRGDAILSAGLCRSHLRRLSVADHTVIRRSETRHLLCFQCWLKKERESQKMTDRRNVYGPDVASFASGVCMTIDGASTDMISILDNHHYVVQNYSSGKPLPTVFLIASDDLRQYPAVTADGKRIIVVLSSPDGLFESNMSRQLHSTGENFTRTGFATPGNHTLVIEFEEADCESIEIVVEVRSCAMGEVPFRNGTLCEPCSSSTYSFPSEGDSVCQTCPENGNCETRVILPDEGYWHLTPCSKHIDRCITHDACVREEREQDLAKMTANVESCDVDEVFIKNYTEARCREVRYHGSHHLTYLELVV